MSKHREIDFEEVVEQGFFHQQYHHLQSTQYNKTTGFFEQELLTFIQESQPQTWERFSARFGNQSSSILIGSLIKTIDATGLLYVLRNGFDCQGFAFASLFFKPNTTMNEKTLTQYTQNRFGIVRQLKFSPRYEGSIDIGLVVNGFPLITMELKNNMTGQTYEHAKEQYRQDRDPSELLFQFNKRSLVHFAFDSEQIYMTTKLNGKNTYFLPFNQGNDGKGGNPLAAENDYSTSYLWKDILSKESLLDIIQRYLHLDGDILIFPRYHQLDAVRKLEQDCKKKGPGHTYLIQHSAGSGKSNSISWLAHRLSTLHNFKNQSVFDSVIIITDRKALDRQLSENISDFEKVDGIVGWAKENSNELAQHIQNKTKIIVTTIQKFSFILGKIDKVKKQNYAIIIDEAHSSQTGEHARNLKNELTSDPESFIANELKKRSNQSNLSFFAFTATPKKETLQLFGTWDAVKQSYEPYHLYSMQQAIDEGFILNVLDNYTTYKTFFTIRSKTLNDPLLQTAEAKKQIYKLANSDDSLIETKTGIMLDQFHSHTRHKLNGRAKAMVVTESRKQAVLYKLEFENQMKLKGITNFNIAVAFSGEIAVKGDKYTEESMNGFAESKLAQHFNTDDYRILIVANKYQTGFNQPLLHTMFVDKRLHDINAVQTLSRLNRTSRLKEDTFVLDFKNTTEDMKKSFEKFCTMTTTNFQIDPQYLYNVRDELLKFNVFSEQDISLFMQNFKHDEKDSHAKMNVIIQKNNRNYEELEEEQQTKFKRSLISYTKSYSFITQMLSLKDQKLKELQSFGKILLTVIASTIPPIKFDIGEFVELEKLRLAKTAENVSIALEQNELGTSVSSGGNGVTQDISPLSEIVHSVNLEFELMHTDDKYEEFFQYVLDKAEQDERVKERAKYSEFQSFLETKEFQHVYDDVVLEGIIGVDVSDAIVDVSIELSQNDDLSQTFLYKLASSFYESMHQ